MLLPSKHFDFSKDNICISNNPNRIELYYNYVNLIASLLYYKYHDTTLITFFF